MPNTGSNMCRGSVPRIHQGLLNNNHVSRLPAQDGCTPFGHLVLTLGATGLYTQQETLVHKGSDLCLAILQKGNSNTSCKSKLEKYQRLCSNIPREEAKNHSLFICWAKKNQSFALLGKIKVFIAGKGNSFEKHRIVR